MICPTCRGHRVIYRLEAYSPDRPPEFVIQECPACTSELDALDAECEMEDTEPETNMTAEGHGRV